MSRFSKTLYLLGTLLFLQTLAILTLSLGSDGKKVWDDSDSLLWPGDPFVLLVIAFTFAISAMLLFLAVLRNSLLPKSS